MSIPIQQQSSKTAVNGQDSRADGLPPPEIHGLSYDPDTEIMITTGCTEANLLAVLGTVDPGRALMMLDPSYADFRTYAEVAGARPLYVRTQPDSHWEVDADDLRKKCAQVSPSALILAIPSNPTGTVLSAESVHAIAETCASEGTWLIYDTVFDQTVFEPDTLPRFSSMKERMIVTGGTSKVFGITGCRVGWMAGPQEVTGRIAQST